MTTPPPTTGVRRLAQADVLLLIAEFIHRPPGRADSSEAIPEDDLQRLADACGLGADSETAAALFNVVRARELSPRQVWKAEHSRLFEGAAVCPPNETAYIRRDKGAILADLSGFFRAFGFDHEDGVGEKQDHVVSQLQFAAVLLVMLARAEAEDRRDHADITRDALKSFAEDHLGAWIDMFCERLIDTADLPSFAQVGVALGGAWRQVCADNAIAAPEAREFELISESQGSPYECDGCPSA